MLVLTGVAVLAGAGFLAGCGASSAPVYRDNVSWEDDRLPRASRDKLLEELSLYQGTPYMNGGDTSRGIDCSGLVNSVYASLGITLPRTVLEQFGQGVSRSRKEVRTGDLVFFGKQGRPTHVGIAVTNREMMHSSSSRGVVLDEIDEFSKSLKIIGIRRVARLL
jgi:cell wall-associated NlpC family hydrolase